MPLPRENVPHIESQGYNLLRVKAIRALIVWCGFPYVFQGALLVAFAGLAISGWNRFAPENVPDKLYAKCNMVNLLIWGLWWPIMIWIAVLLGRAWCAVCPLELVTNGCERVSRRLGIPQRSLKKWVTSGTIILMLYVAILFLVAGLHIHRVPHYTSLFLVSLLVLAVVTGLVFKDRAFCRGFCPVGLLLGTYGRGGMLAVRVAADAACHTCSEKHCTAAGQRNRLDTRSCPSLLNPPKLNSNRDCLVCGQCIKACQPDQMQLLLRKPFPSADAREREASWPATLFVMTVSGFVLYELCSEWATAKHWFLFVPEEFARRMNIPDQVGWIKGIWMLVVVPFAFWTLLGLISMLTGGIKGLWKTWRQLALPMVVLIAAGHMAKGLAKVASWGPFLPGAVRDPAGVDTASALAAHTIAPPPALLPKGIVALTSAVLIALALFFAIREAKIAAPEQSLRPKVLPLAATAAISLVLILGWFPH
jgi:polyferredoxin